jgi:DNA-binding response OmpR family regulator
MRVLLATDRPDLSSDLRLFLSGHGIELADVVSGDAHESTRVQCTEADVVIVDSRLGDASCASIVAGLQGGARRTPVVILCARRDLPGARAAGADGLALLGDPPETLLDALRRATAT